MHVVVLYVCNNVGVSFFHSLMMGR